MEHKAVADTERAWIQLYTGGKFHILDPLESEIRIEDIGHALAMQCRFTGHVRRYYSVAEHSVIGSHLTPAEDALSFLLHDASEAYIADINRPLKHFTEVGPEYMKVEARIMDAVKKKFRLPETDPRSIKEIDNAMLFAEKDQLLPPLDWGTTWGVDMKSANIEVRCWPPEVAEVEFLHRFYQLTNKL